MEANPNTVLLSGQMISFGARRTKIYAGAKTAQEMRAKLFLRCVVCHPTVMLRQETLLANELSYSEYAAAEDYDLWSRFIPHGNVEELPRVLLRYRIHEKQLTKSNPKIAADGQRIRQHFLRLIDLDASVEESALHSRFCEGQFAEKTEFTWMKNWVEKLLQANAETGFADQAAMEKILCRQYMYLLWRGEQKKILSRQDRESLGFPEGVNAKSCRQYGREELYLRFRSRIPY